LQNFRLLLNFYKLGCNNSDQYFLAGFRLLAEGSSLRKAGAAGMAPSPAAAAGPTFEDLERDLQAVLMDQNHNSSADELSMFRSGSAPPTVQGSRTAIGSLFSDPPAHVNNLSGGSSSGTGVDMLTEEDIRSHPAYLSYYYSNEHLNPRLPPPMVSKEDWRAAQRFQAMSGGTGDRRRRPSEVGSGNSLFSVQPGTQDIGGDKVLQNDIMGSCESNGLVWQQSSEWLGRGTDGLVGFSHVSGIGSHRNRFADALQVWKFLRHWFYFYFCYCICIISQSLKLLMN
jgi:pumilio RNA-binding family